MTRNLKNALGFGATLLVAALICMLASYAVVREMVRSGAAPNLHVERQRENAQLREFRDELVRLASEFLERTKRYPAGSSEELQDWTTHEFLPRLNDLRRRMQEAMLPAEPFAALFSAAERVAAAAGQPDRADLRVTATDEALEAASIVDTFLAARAGRNQE